MGGWWRPVKERNQGSIAIVANAQKQYLLKLSKACSSSTISLPAWRVWSEAGRYSLHMTKSIDRDLLQRQQEDSAGSGGYYGQGHGAPPNKAKKRSALY